MFIAINLMDLKILEDPLFPNRIKYSEILIKTIHFLSGKDIKDCQKIYHILDLENKFKKAVVKIREYKINIHNYHDSIQINGDKYKYKDIEINISKEIRKKLKKRYIGNDFERDIFILMLRYKTFGGEAHQFSMEIKFKKTLQKEYGIDF